jgi:hypothetical protein
MVPEGRANKAGRLVVASLEHSFDRFIPVAIAIAVHGRWVWLSSLHFLRSIFRDGVAGVRVFSDGFVPASAV